MVDPSTFTAPEVGHVIRTPGRHGYHAFVPEPLPQEVSLANDTVLLLSDADRALGRLAGAGRHLPDPHVLIMPYVTREALASSRIEGTQASLSEVLDAQARDVVATGDVAEVVNYIHGLEHGLARLSDLPVCVRLLCEVHKILLTDVRGAERRPGEIRATQNWIGSPDNTIESAVFVPPPAEELGDVLASFEKYLNEHVAIPPLVRAALAHYQFETIHPFLDGNDRVGRLLVVFLLTAWGLLPEPLLYLSTWFETRRSEYYDRLQAVRERGEVEEWLRFFLRGVATQAQDALERAERLSDLRERYRERVAGSRARLPEVIDLMFQNPMITASRVAKGLDISQPGAMNLVRRLEDDGMLVEVEQIPGRAKRWVASEVYEVLDSGD